MLYDEDELFNQLLLIAENEGRFYEKRDARGASNFAKKHLMKILLQDLWADMRVQAKKVETELKKQWKREEKEMAASMVDRVAHSLGRRAMIEKLVQDYIVAFRRSGPIAVNISNTKLEHAVAKAAEAVIGDYDKAEAAIVPLVEKSLGDFLKKYKKDRPMNDEAYDEYFDNGSVISRIMAAVNKTVRGFEGMDPDEIVEILERKKAQTDPIGIKGDYRDLKKTLMRIKSHYEEADVSKGHYEKVREMFDPMERRDYESPKLGGVYVIYHAVPRQYAKEAMKLENKIQAFLDQKFDKPAEVYFEGVKLIVRSGNGENKAADSKLHASVIRSLEKKFGLKFE